MSRFDKSYILLIPYFLVLLLPAFRLRVRLIFVVLLMLLWLIIMLFKWKEHDRELSMRFWATIIPLILFLAAQVLGTYYGEKATFGYPISPLYASIVGSVLNIIPIIVLHITISARKFHEAKVLLFVIICCFAAGALMFANFEVGSTRMIASGIADDASVEYLMQRYDILNGGVSSYGSVYAMAIAIVFLVFYVGSVKKSKQWYVWVLLSIYLFGIVRATYSIAILGIVFGFVLHMVSISLLNRSYLVKKIFPILCIISIVIVACPWVLSFLAPIFRQLSQSTDVHEYVMRLESIADALEGDKGTYAYERAQLFVTSWNSFLQYPLFGRLGAAINGSNVARIVIGGHSYVVDALANCGIVFTSLFFIFWINMGRYITILVNRYGNNQKVLCGWYAALYTMLFVSSINQMTVPEPYIMLCLVLPFLVIFRHDRIKSMT